MRKYTEIPTSKKSSCIDMNFLMKSFFFIFFEKFFLNKSDAIFFIVTPFNFIRQHRHSEYFVLLHEASCVLYLVPSHNDIWNLLLSLQFFAQHL